jgi:SPP1 family predicted phage head-tail adaptor
MDKKITIQQPSQVDDGGGSYVPGWSTLSSPWAMVSQPAAYEKISAEKLGQTISKKFTIWYDSRVTTAMRISYDGSYYYIKSIVDPDESKNWLEIMGEEKS